MKFVQKTNNIKRRLRKIEREFPKIRSEAAKEFKDITPKDTGNARRNTTLKGNEIQANYPYANRLNQGWSKQAPDGMTKATIEFIRRLIRRI
jgi:hypothetical protein